MKISKLFYLFISVPILFLGSCGEPEEIEPSGYLKFDREEYELNVGYINDNGTNDEITYRKYKIDLVDQSTNPENHITFIIYSNSTTRLQEGVYTYEYLPSVGNVSYLKTQLGLAYDEGGEKVEGDVYKEGFFHYDGDITISMVDGDYKFVFDLTIDIDGTPMALTGEFHDVLKDGYVSY